MNSEPAAPAYEPAVPTNEPSVPTDDVGSSPTEEQVEELDSDDEDTETTADKKLRNRRAAKKYREKTKTYQGSLAKQLAQLEGRRSVLSNQVKSLHAEVLALKQDILLHGECGSAIIDAFITRSATRISGGLLKDVPVTTSPGESTPDSK